MHYIERGGEQVPAAETEYADDPVLPFAHSELDAYVAERSERRARLVGLEVVRAGGFANALTSARAGEVIIPDIENAADVAQVAAGIEEASARGGLARCAQRRTARGCARRCRQ